MTGYEPEINDNVNNEHDVDYELYNDDRIIQAIEII